MHRKLTAPGYVIALFYLLLPGFLAAPALAGVTDARDDAVDPLVGYLRVSTQSSEQTAALRALLDIRTKRAAEEALASLYVVSNEQRRKSYEAQFGKILESKIRNQ